MICCDKTIGQTFCTLKSTLTYNSTGYEILLRITRHTDTQHNDTQHNDTQHNDTQHNDTQHNDIMHYNK
jgi:hypothetical protein